MSLSQAGWGGARDGAGRGRIRTLEPDALAHLARQGMSRARAAQFLGVGWAVVAREASRLRISFRSVRHYGHPQLPRTRTHGGTD